MMTMAERLKLMGKEEGLKEGLNQGMDKGVLMVAKNLLKQGQTIQFISKVTGLSQARLKTL